MSKQTATDYLIQEIKNDALVQAKSTQEWNEVFKKAKQMEREQIIDAYTTNSVIRVRTKAEQYYNQTYGVKGRENKTFMSEEEWVKEYTGEKGRDIGGSEYGDYR
jgi:hypothetical protein